MILTLSRDFAQDHRQTPVILSNSRPLQHRLKTGDPHAEQ
jgi:hypothetical protein